MKCSGRLLRVEQENEYSELKEIKPEVTGLDTEIAYTCLRALYLLPSTIVTFADDTAIFDRE